MSRAKRKFDSYDIAILTALGRNPRITTVELSKVIHLSRTAIARRILILRDKGAFLDVPDLVSYQALGFDIDATVDIALPSNGVSSASRDLLKKPEVLSVSTTTGFGHLVVRAIAVNMAHFRRLIDYFQRYGDVSTNIVMSTARSTLPLGERMKAVRRLAQEAQAESGAREHDAI